MANEGTPTASVPATADPPQASGLQFPVVGIGASAGGLPALQRFLENLPANPGLAVVVVLHLSPSHESNADKILQRFTPMPVRQVRTSTRIEPDHVYVISPALELLMEDGSLHVQQLPKERGPQIAIDRFLRTLADAHHGRAIGVILSGTGSDGTVGIARIKERGGVTFAQLPGDCEYPDMPRSAVAGGHIDFVLPAPDIPRALLQVAENARRIALPPVDPAEPGVPVDMRVLREGEEALQGIIKILAERTGHDFTHYKRATVLRRMERRLQVRTLPDLPSYRDFLHDRPEETRPLLEDMLISVTNFFRDTEVFEALADQVVPDLVRRAQAEGPARIWVPGCATGEEAYSIAILMDEAARGHTPQADFQVFATDIDEPAIVQARRGVYPASILADVGAARLATYFEPDHGSYRIRKPIRERVLFAPHNMLRDPAFSRLDLVSCRNTLIYLNRDIQEKLLEMFHFALRPGGYLLLGNSETAEAAADLFDPVDKRNRLFQSKRAAGDTGRRTPSMPLRVGTLGRHALRGSVAVRSSAAMFAELHQRVLEKYAPPSVIVDRDSNVVHMSEQAGQYLRHGGGVPSANLLALVHPELRIGLRTALFQAIQTGQSVEARRVRLKRGGGASYVNMIARPFTDAEAAADFVLVLFEEVEITMSGGVDREPAEDVAAQGEDGANDLVDQLEKELERTRAQWQVTIQQGEASSEELKASNEELQAINEELRSTTEELEISAEELQSVNEELVTVNAELRAKVDETESVNDDLKNFIASTDIATVFVDGGMNIRRYTPAAGAIFNIIPSDVGRSLLDITHRLDYPQLADDIDGVLESLQAVQREVAGADGGFYIARVRPYQTINGEVEGAVLTFVDATSLHRAEAMISRGDQEMRRAVLHSNEFAVVAIDANGYIIGWNSGAETVFGHSASEIGGHRIHDIFVPEDVAAGVPEQEMETARETGRAIDERWHLRSDDTRVFCSGVMTPVDLEGLRGYVKIVRDATQRRQVEEQGQEQLATARAAHAEARATIALKDEFLAVMSHELKHPLNLINVNAELIARSVDSHGEDPVVARALATIGRAVRSQSRIVDDLLDLSRIRTGKLALDLAAVDLSMLARSAVENASADASASAVGIALGPGESHVLVLADAARVNQILWNLLGNAVKFTPAGGTIEVRVTCEEGFGRLDVIDSGQGIEPSMLPRIFEMFGQARARALSSQSGLGIGLAVVRQLVEHHGGRVEAASAGLGKGAHFTVWLPLVSTEEDRATGLATQSAHCAGMRILVVDDDRHTVDALAMLLSLEGADVSSAISGNDALALAVADAPDVVLSDLGMPGMDGYELLRQLRANPATAALPVIALTGFGRDNDERRTREAGFDGHIAKPVSIPRLLRRIAEVVQKATALPMKSGAGSDAAQEPASSHQVPRLRDSGAVRGAR